MGSLEKDFQEIFGWNPLEADVKNSIWAQGLLGCWLQEAKQGAKQAIVTGDWGSVPPGISERWWRTHLSVVLLEEEVDEDIYLTNPVHHCLRALPRGVNFPILLSCPACRLSPFPCASESIQAKSYKLEWCVETEFGWGTHSICFTGGVGI